MYNKELKQTQISQTAIFTTGSMRASKILPSFILVLTVFFSDYFFNYGKDIVESLDDLKTLLEKEFGAS